MGEGGGLPQGVGVVGTGRVGGGMTTFVFFPGTLVAWEGSSSPRFFLLLLGSGLGGTKGVGDDGAVDGPEPLAAPLRPFTPAPPFRNLLCTDDRVSVKLLRSVLGVAAAAERPLLPLPFGVRLSRSLVGESQNLKIVHSR